MEIYKFEGPTGSSVGLYLSINIRLVVLSKLCVMRSADTFTSKMNLNSVLILWIGIYQYWPLFIKILGIGYIPVIPVTFLGLRITEVPTINMQVKDPPPPIPKERPIPAGMGIETPPDTSRSS